LAASLSPLTLGQTVNTRLLARVDRYPGATSPTNNYAGIWGMVVNGREIAVVPARAGTVFYDCTNPASPTELGLITGPGSTSMPYFWREANSYGNYAYISSEHGVLQCINLSSGTPVLASTFGARAHSLSIDQGTGRLWANGGASPGGGCTIFNLVASPTAPPQVATYSAAYVHDCYPYGGHTYLAQINTGTVRILSTANFPTLTTLSTTITPGQFTHNAWVNKAATLMVTTDENRGGCLTFYDVTNKSVPIQLSTFCSPSGATVHNAFILGKVCFLASYSAGFYAIDVSEPATPRLICSYDTSPQTNNDYHGNWGCYPFQPSGKIYLSDMQTGFHIVEPTCGVPLQYGTGTPGTAGKTPAIDYGGGFAQVARSTFKLDCTDLAANAPLALFVSSAAASVPIFGITLNVDLGSPNVQVVGGANAQGTYTANVPLPAQAHLAGGTLHAQVITVDAGGPQGLAASRGFRVTICP
jgi:choice-of-anchor B domain-containing protein